MENVLFEFYRGDTYTRDFTLTGWSLPVSDVYFTVKESVDHKKARIQKRLNKGIEIVDVNEEGNTFNLKINATDTDDLKADFDYIFDIEIHSDTGEELVKKTIVTGVLRVLASATKTCNEVK